jgi:leucyl/phenylalanyl-tRNA--protein transferase
MKVLLKRDAFEFTINKAFRQVMESCQQVYRPDQDGTWINQEVIDGYLALYQGGYALSAEAWADNTLVGGLYGVRLGQMFFGESMFSTKSNASKFAFIKLVEQLKQEGVVLIDCQVYSEHLESLGGEQIPRSRFMRILKSAVPVLPGVIYELQDIESPD